MYDHSSARHLENTLVHVHRNCMASGPSLFDPHSLLGPHHMQQVSEMHQVMQQISKPQSWKNA